MKRSLQASCIGALRPGHKPVNTFISRLDGAIAQQEVHFELLARVGDNGFGLRFHVLVEPRPPTLCPLMAFDLQYALLHAIRASTDGRLYSLMSNCCGAHGAWYGCARLRHHGLYLIAIVLGRIDAGRNLTNKRWTTFGALINPRLAHRRPFPAFGVGNI